MMSTAILEGHRTFIITPNDQSGTIVVTATLLMTWSLLCLLIRVYNRLSLSSSLGIDDLASGISTVRATINLCRRKSPSLTASKLLGVIQTIVACVGVSHGLGKSSTLLRSPQLKTISDVRFIAALHGGFRGGLS